jgi:hypothetical protein
VSNTVLFANSVLTITQTSGSIMTNDIFSISYSGATLPSFSQSALTNVVIKTQDNHSNNYIDTTSSATLEEISTSPSTQAVAYYSDASCASPVTDKVVDYTLEYYCKCITHDNSKTNTVTIETNGAINCTCGLIYRLGVPCRHFFKAVTPDVVFVPAAACHPRWLIASTKHTFKSFLRPATQTQTMSSMAQTQTMPSTFAMPDSNMWHIRYRVQ